MRFPSSHLQTLAITCLFTLTTALPATVIKREEDLKSSYDYIIVGGGTSGLVIANRLTEDPKTTVLVIEAEFHLSKKMKSFPGYVGRTGAKYEWGYNTSAISGLNDRKFRIPAAKVVGGGSVINGMFYTRGSKEDYDSWEKLGNPGWGWEDLRKWFNKSETFHRQPEDSGVTFDLSTHGTTGPIQTSYPPLRYPQLRESWFLIHVNHELSLTAGVRAEKIINAMKSFGIPTALDGTNGHSLGKFWVLNTLDPRNQTRSYAQLIMTQPSRGKLSFDHTATSY
ncbi:Similar to Glucose oxidase; acc. no. P81156 [Pyronema omphalodes CBS 100304]|uniref:Similar to Glucose oxidase acc. no. P81156 n=1 Tax=Pyronema omphalodes (strain CBS 100304) TaxID=1076935 RepID=U4KXZ2_PYROM|nr:Similar to Glucose oxidase; acc. no. P81156 [Pyronema omphalodes CBS 100304]